MMCDSKAIVVALLVLVVPITAMATVIHVPADQPTIQEGINEASNGDTVIVAAGTYIGPLNRNLDFAGTNQVLVSAAGRAETVIDCEGVARGFYFDGGESSASLVQGFTVVNGAGAAYGGGIYCRSGSAPTVVSCAFIGCEAQHGGGAWCHGSSPTFTDCIFADNVAATQGGGMYCYESSPELTRITFSGNQASQGGGIYCWGAGLTIANCTFCENQASAGGGVHCKASALTITNAIIAFSAAGEAVSCEGTGDPVIAHCVVFANAGGDSLCGTYHDNLFVDPLFCDMYNSDYTLCANSPCLPESPQNPWAELVGAHEGGCGDCDSPVEPASWGAIKAMFGRRDRVCPPS